jgi:hypothetical protein
MSALDPSEEWRNLTELYRQMTDEELVALAQENSELTDIAQQTLSREVAHRGLKIPPKRAIVPPLSEPDPDSEYAEDRELVDLCTVWSLADAVQLQTLLDQAGVPFFMGPERAMGADAVTSSFVNGVSVQIMRIGLPWTRQTRLPFTAANVTPRKSSLGV